MGSLAGGLALYRSKARETAELGQRLREIEGEKASLESALTNAPSKEERDRLLSRLEQLEHEKNRLPAATARPTVKTPQRVSAPSKADPCEEIRKNPSDPRRFDPTNPCL